MHFEIKSTRHTAIGTLRRGVIYNLDDRNQKVRQALKPMLEGDPPAATRLTDEEAAERKAEVLSLELPAHVHEDPDTIDEVAELEARLTVAEKDKATVELERDAAITRAETAEASLAEAVTRAETAEAALAVAMARADAAEAELAKAATATKADKK